MLVTTHSVKLSRTLSYSELARLCSARLHCAGHVKGNVFEKYDFGETIGEGGYGKVRMVREKVRT